MNIKISLNECAWAFGAPRDSDGLIYYKGRKIGYLSINDSGEYEAYFNQNKYIGKADTIEELERIVDKEYSSLILAQHILNALYNGGVDNWAWYAESLQKYANSEGFDSWQEFEESIKASD